MVVQPLHSPFKGRDHCRTGRDHCPSSPKQAEIAKGRDHRLATGGWTGRDFAFPDTHFAKALLAMLSALRLVAGSKHAPRAFDRATWQAGEYTKPTSTRAK